MKLENQVCTLEQAKRLKELGIIGKPTFYHNISIGTINQISMFNENDLSNGGDWYPAYTTSE